MAWNTFCFRRWLERNQGLAYDGSPRLALSRGWFCFNDRCVCRHKPESSRWGNLVDKHRRPSANTNQNADQEHKSPIPCLYSANSFFL